MNYYTHYHSPISELTIASDGSSITGLWLKGQKYYMSEIIGSAEEANNIPLLLTAKKWLDSYFAGENPNTDGLPLAPAGSDFRKAVWRILLEIPYGECATYKEVAKQMASKDNRLNLPVRAVGGAIGHNPISIIIPCHRVIGTDGSITGYAGGIEKKLHLLAHEGIDISRFKE